MIPGPPDGFPWPDPDQFTRGLVLSLAKVKD